MTRVLYVNHTSALGGGEFSLLELIVALPSDVSPILASPDGPLGDAARRLTIPFRPIDAFVAGFGGNVLRVPASLGRFVQATRSLRRAIADATPELIHANSVRAGLLAIVATGRGGPPVLVHVRDCLPASRAGRLVRRFICSRATLLLANSRYTANTFVQGFEVEARVVYPSLDIARFDPALISKADARARLGLGNDDAVLGVVGQLTEWKGQLDAITTLSHLRIGVPDAKLLIAGSVKFNSTRFDNAAYEQSLRQEAARLGVSDAIHFLGERTDIPEVLRALDLLLVPSWEEPLGRIVLEGMAIGLPVLATCIGGPAEVIEDGVDGILLPPRDPARWAKAAATLLAAPGRRAALGQAALQKARDGFGLEAPTDAALNAYASVLGRRPRSGGTLPLARATKEASWKSR